MDNNRIGDPCWYLNVGLARRGIVRHWGDYREGDVAYPVVVVEDDRTRTCITVQVDEISFSIDPPWPRERGGETDLLAALEISLAAMQANIAYAAYKDEPALALGIEAARAAIAKAKGTA